jgi:predicted nucleotidyltransferase
MAEWLLMAEDTGEPGNGNQTSESVINESRIALESQHLAQLLNIVRQTMAGSHGQVLLFGSRARGNPGPASDIDLAVSVKGEVGGLLSRLRESLDDSTIPFTADIVDMASCGPALAAEVQAEGVVVWES